MPEKQKTPKTKRRRLTIDMSTIEGTALEEISKTQEQSPGELARKGIRLLIALNRGEIFLSVDPNCASKVPHSIL